MPSTLILVACAEGTKVDVPSAVDDWSGVGGSHMGGFGGAKSAGAAKGAIGGIPGKNTLPNKLASAGSASLLSSGAGGRSISVGGAAFTESGGANGAMGGNTASGGGLALSVPAPTSGLGVTLVRQQMSGQNTCATDMTLVNKGSTLVDLKDVRIRYYFTVDGWTTPVWVVDYAGKSGAQVGVSPILFSVVPAQPTADHYYELSFSGAALDASAQLEIKSRLYDLNNLGANAANDYSFVGSVGFTNRITVYVAGQLVWGVEPGGAAFTGTGGASGTAGAASTGVAGAAYGGQNAAGAPHFAGHAGSG